jgi:hypothetical protein
MACPKVIEETSRSAVLRATRGRFGAAFVGVELYEFSHLIAEGAGPQRSAFLSAFFTLTASQACVGPTLPASIWGMACPKVIEETSRSAVYSMSSRT